LTKTELAYVAASIDGEGSIAFKIRKTSKTPWLFDIRITLTNTNRAWLRWLKSLIGGTISTNCIPKPKNKQGYRLQINGHKACKALLHKLLPYLKIKHKQAKLALKYQPVELKDYANRWAKSTLSRAIKARRASWFFRMKALNKRGTQ
jgi:hypothetical protein